MLVRNEPPIPRSWSRLRFGDCAEFINGRAYGQDELLEAGTPVLRIQNLTGGDRWYYSNLKLPKDKYCEDGDLLFAWSASFGPYIWKGPKCIFHYHIWRVIPRQNLDKKFAYYLLGHLTRELKTSARGIAMLHLTKSGMEAHEISLPPLDEQRRIAAILDQADDLRRKRRQAITGLSLLARGIFIELFESGRPHFASESLENLIIDQKIGIVRSSEKFGENFEFPYVRMDAITKTGEFDESKVLKTSASTQERKDYELKKGDFLFNTRNSRELVGKTTLFPGGEGTVFNNNIMRIRFRTIVLPEYIAAVFQRPIIQSQIESRKSGTTSVYAVYWRELKSLRVPVPPIERQRAFAARTSEINGLKNCCNIHLAKFDALFASLQRRAFRGEQ